MKIKECSPTLLEFETTQKEMPISILNGLRRICHAEVKTFTIDFVFLLENNSFYNDEFLIHRLGLVPFVVDTNNVTNVSSDKNFNEDLEIVLKVDNKTTQDRKVYSSDFEVTPNGRVNFHPVFFEGFEKGIHLLTLAPTQSVHFVCKLKEGCGALHSKWSPVSTVYYKQITEEKMKFVIESTGAKTSLDIFRTAVSLFKKKIESITDIQLFQS
mgnify:CR=1 FL=1|tara:strand:- start:170 stop:808 length:639 start_codon:yes stop_codon:yes gene_type:complete